MLTCLRCYHWRNLSSQPLNFDSSTIFLVGENGQGKTNLLEAIYYLIYQSSWRSYEPRSLLRHGESDGLALQGAFSFSNASQVKLSLKLQGNTKTLLKDGQCVQDRKEFFRVYAPLIFSPGDLRILQGPPQGRREFLDQTLTLLEENYLGLWRSYARVLAHRNILIRQKSEEELNAFDPIFVRLAGSLVESRRRLSTIFTRKINFYSQSLLSELPPIQIYYEPSLEMKGEEENLDFLKKKRKKELLQGFSLYGPHKDQFNLKCDGNLVSLIASQGQMRMVVLCLRLMQAELLGETNERLPTLLLDDILLELDAQKREIFFKLLPAYTQAFFTFLPHEPFLSYCGKQELVYRVKKGFFTPYVV